MTWLATGIGKTGCGHAHQHVGPATGNVTALAAEAHSFCENLTAGFISNRTAIASADHVHEQSFVV
jgi:hypothetical protein